MLAFHSNTNTLNTFLSKNNRYYTDETHTPLQQQQKNETLDLRQIRNANSFQQE